MKTYKVINKQWIKSIMIIEKNKAGSADAAGISSSLRWSSGAHDGCLPTTMRAPPRLEWHHRRSRKIQPANENCTAQESSYGCLCYGRCGQGLTSCLRRHRDGDTSCLLALPLEFPRPVRRRHHDQNFQKHNHSEESQNYKQRTGKYNYEASD